MKFIHFLSYLKIGYKISICKELSLSKQENIEGFCFSFMSDLNIKLRILDIDILIKYIIQFSNGEHNSLHNQVIT